MKMESPPAQVKEFQESGESNEVGSYKPKTIKIINGESNGLKMVNPKQ